MIKKHLYKSCPRCNGDLFADPESLEVAERASDLLYVCLQCGRSTSRGALLQTVKQERVRTLERVA